MADIVISIVAKVTEYLVKPAISRGRYFLCVSKVIKDLENETKELTFESAGLKDRVELVKERAEVIEKPVEEWLNDVENLLKEVAGLEQSMGANNNCFQGWCPIWRRYCLCEQMVEKIEAMRKFKGKSNIQPFSHPAPLPGIQYGSSENIIYFESTKVAYNELLEALKDDSIYMIGVYGMGGSGKTTLVTEAGKKAEQLNLFDKVILITVSQTPSIRDVQGKIADMLNLKLEEETKEGRAQRIWQSLKEKKRILVIVDDLWRKFNLEDIGICLQNDNKGAWKILITTRNQSVCTSMDCQKKIHLGLLSEDESWSLFQKHANIDDEFSKSLDDVPRKLCNECKGLPIAIVTVGSSLKGKSKDEWEVALNSLRDSEAFNDHEGVRAALCCLKLSYDYLENNEVQLLFLMCSMFPEDYNILIEDLIQLAIGLGVGGRSSLKSMRSWIKAGINKLLDSCLLMSNDYLIIHGQESKEYMKMHDMVREAALWIAKKFENCKILVNVDKPLSTLAEDDSIRDCFAVSSWYKENQIFCKLHAPKLEILLLNTVIGRKIGTLSHESFEETQRLKVFSVTKNTKYYVDRPLLQFPQTIHLWTNLRILRLNGWELGDIAFIASLTTLQVLDLRQCEFNELPNEIGKLQRLRLLDLSECDILRENYNGAIGKCSQLEELYASECGPEKYLCQIAMDIGILPKLQRFVIHTGHIDIPYYAECMRVLAVTGFNISELRAYKRNILQTAEIIGLKRLAGGCKSIIPDMGDMNDLTSLCLEFCKKIECIFDTTSDSEIDDLIPRLVELRLSGLYILKELCRGPPMQVLPFFEKLKRLEIWNCPKLHSIFPSECTLQNLKILVIDRCMSVQALFSTHVAQRLQQLEELTIAYCKELKHIIASGRDQGIVPAPRNSHFLMPSLKTLCIDSCWKLELVFPICCVEGLAQLQQIQISGAPRLKYVFGECDHDDHSAHQYQNHIMLPHLEVLSLESLENLVGICPENYHAKWSSPRKLTMKNCQKLATSWIAVMDGSYQRQHHLNEKLPSKLQELYLDSLPQMNLISWVGSTPRQILSLQCLQHLHVNKSENLKSLFSMEVQRTLPELMSLTICDCQELEQIIAANKELVQLPNAEVYFPKLTDIRVKNCNKLKSLFSVAMVRMLPQLSTLHISNATQLEEIFRHGSGDSTTNEMEIMLPNLTKIKLYKLSSFVDICQGCKLRAVKLQELDIDECPKTAPSLIEIQKKQRPLGEDDEGSFKYYSELFDMMMWKNQAISMRMFAAILLLIEDLVPILPVVRNQVVQNEVMLDVVTPKADVVTPKGGNKSRSFTAKDNVYVTTETLLATGKNVENSPNKRGRKASTGVSTQESLVDGGI
ncbi:P-loop containing nucleoside triphosphate hydrolase [Sesbania bispinosa]|nr:P-loop containing nucleoside triphosphate hydrolase [Sesbania bispinosa]